MLRIGVTGHMNLTPNAARLVFDALRSHLVEIADEVTGVSCIARGADSLFAEAVLETGGALEVVLPSRDYRDTKVNPDHAEQFDRLLSKATRVRTMDFSRASREAYVAANEAMLGSVDELVAVWDGQPAVDRGGTASVVANARQRGVRVTVIWPEGAARE
ncbi:hypothetical protein GCM10010517_43710 [Streptosporangium fragile]|uniref:DUF1273 domain-containing protein n=2 Tax=Streptosporangium fragile TaxID=46186 RepID=A0ABP6IJT1_9ACTN